MPARVIRVGDATASVMNLGDLAFRLRDVERSPESEWRPRYGDLFDQRLLFPNQSVHIATHGASILVDAGDFALFASADPSYAPVNYTPPPPLTDQLSLIGVDRMDVTHVVITHAHYDHYAGVTTKKKDGTYLPTFPRARYLLGRGDWENREMQEAVHEKESAQGATLGVVNASGTLELVDVERRLTPVVTILASPGESPGHQIVKVQSRRETLYCLGDLFHHAVELDDLRLMATWCDALANVRSRRELVRSALKENAILVAAHMPPGRIAGSVESPKFEPV